MTEDWNSEYRDVARLQYTEIERLHAELDQLRTENRRLLDWIMGDGPDALTELQKVYSDPKTTEPNRIKAAASALPFERGKPATANVIVQVDFRERVRQARLRAYEKEKLAWQRKQELDAALAGPTPTTLIGGGPDSGPAIEGEVIAPDDPAA